jgi:hypothetical protein
METLSIWFFKFLTLVFTIGWIGCLLTIPMAAFKFFSVLFDKDADQPDRQEQYEQISPSRP